ncbi:hypothetical protein IRM71_17720 (plasmid) [Erwinia amylovora]|uniref:hypothetical protein n=1 Tax=Erwinia amylovora TaxID=552 RepID=UPI001D068261|nr:hypothetical protein [Erwinia amylovora]UDJ88616.1 hypothetical protein IRM68_17720 [Erwinia amylovora]UDK91364.1 hypothetical protein IRM70_17710 [Erwinia amylovora]UDK94721.1 hypothetical protein IRM71_17720 [Erwinia amylovora]UER93234.1 hypothetical protein IRM69_17800 [Erwinia amylovora]UOD76507.1 hypothetical protein IRM67_17805 [Erwinia amylovora]
MKLNSIKDAYDLMHYCHMPVSCQRELRDMKVGDTYFFGQFKECIFSDALKEDVEFVGEAWIEKERGIYKFYATWTIPMKPSRAMIMTSGQFKILKGGVIDFGSDTESFKSFALVSRYLNRLVIKMTSDERNGFYSAGTKPLFRGVCVDKNYVSNRDRFIKDGEGLKRVRVDYSNYLPTHQLQAIVTAGLALNQI